MDLANRTSTPDRSLLTELLQFALIVAFVIFPIRIFIAQPFVVNGESMSPTFETGQYLIVDQLTYRFTEPKRGSVVIFKYPKDTSKFFIKRIIGLPGETVQINNGVITIINSENPEGFVYDQDYISLKKQDDDDRTLDDTEFYVMGDNRPGSSDSREWGALPEHLIIGRPFTRLLPVAQISLFPGDHSIE